MPEYEYDTVTASEPNKPVWVYESVHEPPKFAVLVPAVTLNGDAANVITDDVTSDVGPVFPAGSATPFAASFNCSVPSWHWVTTTFTDEPDAADGVNTQPCAEPAFEKSPAAIPETDSVKARPNVNDIAAAGDDGADDTDAPGGSTSMFKVDDAVGAPGPVCEVTSEVIASWSTVRMTDPDVTLDPVRPTVYEAPDPENEEIDQPVLVPDRVISDCNNPLTDSLNWRL